MRVATQDISPEHANVLMRATIMCPYCSTDYSQVRMRPMLLNRTIGPDDVVSETLLGQQIRWLCESDNCRFGMLLTVKEVRKK